MEQLEITCPACGETVSFARRCRKCGALLDGVREPQPKMSEKASFQVALVSEILQNKQGPENGISDPLQARLRAPHQYFLKVSDPSGRMPDKMIPVRAKGTLARWKVTKRESRTILSTYFYIHAEGHDLDTWIHYDLETGQELGMNTGDESDPDPAAHIE